MPDKKMRLELHDFLNRDGICRHLEKMAEKGWLLEKMGGLMWTYRRISPRKLKFALYYSPTADEENAEAMEKQNAFYEMCRHDGWEFACADWGMQVFYNQRPDPVPLETEPALEVDRIHTTAMCWLVPYWLITIPSFVLGIYRQLKRYSNLLAMAAAQGVEIPGLDSAWVVNRVILGLMYLGSIAAYFFWYCRAKKAAREGVFLNPSGTFWPVLVVCLLGLAFTLLRL